MPEFEIRLILVPVAKPYRSVDARQRPATPASAWRSGIRRQLTRQPHLLRVRTTSRTPLAINNAVEVAPDAHGGHRRPSCVRVCCRTRALCAVLYALRPEPACVLLRPGTVVTTDVRNALVRPPPALIGRWMCPTPRAYHATDGEAPARTSWEQLALIAN
ncbi:hypothetical protein EVAR_20147_1 [Eumeta japonica]|uniref:Uncharacterized protein n=1 Tax=Eumeta variegata TaxID=151549 RepID=A0A4C1V3V4_EUMVA|nr:hypothetical protein EVAR_20147_1 [Eumeta japonica]